MFPVLGKKRNVLRVALSDSFMIALGIPEVSVSEINLLMFYINYLKKNQGLQDCGETDVVRACS